LAQARAVLAVPLKQVVLKPQAGQAVAVALATKGGFQHLCSAQQKPSPLPLRQQAASGKRQQARALPVPMAGKAHSGRTSAPMAAERLLLHLPPQLQVVPAAV
jgi:hypothetical protein